MPSALETPADRRVAVPVKPASLRGAGGLLESLKSRLAVGGSLRRDASDDASKTGRRLAGSADSTAQVSRKASVSNASANTASISKGSGHPAPEGKRTDSRGTGAIRGGFNVNSDNSLRVLLGLAVALLIISGIVFSMYLKGNASLQALAMLASQGSSQAGELTVASEAGMRADADAAEALASAHRRLGDVFKELSLPESTLSASAAMLNSLDASKASWTKVDTAARQLLDARDVLADSAKARGAVLAATGPMLIAGRSLMSDPVSGRNAIRDTARVGELALLTQQLGVQAASALDPVSPSFGRTEALRNTLVALEPAIVAASESFPGSAPELARIRAEVEPLAGLLTPVLARADMLTNLGAARQAVAEGSAAVRDSLNAARDAVPPAIEHRSWLSLAAAVLAIVAALCGLTVSRIYMKASSARAVQAEQQREVAEQLEAEAKRANEMNQAAILRLMNELQEVADGDLTVQATVSEDITGAIADSVNYTIEELRSLVSRINLTAEQVNGASSKAQMTAAGLLAATEQQSREIKDTGESVLEMARRINEVSARAAESVQVARQSLTASEGGSKAVNHTISGMNMIRDQIQETAKRIKRLGESSQEIGEIVQLISSLTEQTNTLALNAAIQAASAGEAGRGFSIVAEEVQRLAERSAEATNQISRLIKTIQADTQDAVAAMERSTQGVVDGTRRSDEAGRSLESIGTVSAQLAELIESFSRTTSRQAVSAGSVAQSIQRILLVNEQTSKGTSQTANSISRLSELAQELKNSVSRFKVV